MFYGEPFKLVGKTPGAVRAVIDTEELQAVVSRQRCWEVRFVSGQGAQEKVPITIAEIHITDIGATDEHGASQTKVRVKFKVGQRVAEVELLEWELENTEVLTQLQGAVRAPALEALVRKLWSS